MGSRSFQGSFPRSVASEVGGSAQVVTRVRSRFLRSLFLRVVGDFLVLFTNGTYGLYGTSMTSFEVRRFVRGEQWFRVYSESYSFRNVFYAFSIGDGRRAIFV